MLLNRDFIISELSKVTNPKIGRRGVSIICPFHRDNDPSLNVSLENGKVKIGVWHCFGCDQSGGWNKLAEKFGLRTIGEDDNNGISLETKTYLSEPVELYSPIFEDDLDLSPITEDWRRYSPKFMRMFEAKKLWDETYKDNYIFLPVTRNGDYKGHIRCKIKKDSPGPKYWFNLKEKLTYPFDYYLDKDCRVMILVEGVADAFRLIKSGLMATAILGNANEKLVTDCLTALMVKRVIIAFDGDAFGQTARFKFADEFEKQGIDVRIFETPDGYDPDDMKNKAVIALTKFYNRCGGEFLYV